MKKVAIIFWEDYLAIAPTIISLAKSFSKKNFNVDIYTTELSKRYPKISFEESNINIFCLKGNKKEKNKIESRINKLLLNKKLKIKFILSIYKILKNIYKFLIEIKNFIKSYKFKYFINKNLKNNNYNLYIVVDSTGLINFNSNLLKTESDIIFFLSLEIDEKKLINPLLNPFKFLCYNNFKNKIPLLKNIIIQDKNRANILLEEFYLKDTDFKFYYLPNSINKANNFNRNYLLNNKYGINNNIILHIGQISKTALSYEIATSLNSQNRFTLVFHDKKNTDISDPYIQLILQSTNYPVHFSLNPVHFKELDEIILSAQIGILAYSSEFGKNFEIITNASGKLIMLLRLGIPVIVFEFPGIKDLINKYQCGVVVNNWQDVLSAADLIMTDLEYYRNNAINCFNNEFDFEKYFQLFFNKLYLN